MLLLNTAIRDLLVHVITARRNLLYDVLLLGGIYISSYYFTTLKNLFVHNITAKRDLLDYFITALSVIIGSVTI